MRCEKVIAQLSAFLDGELKPKEAERVQAHLDSCVNCRKEREAIERTMQLVRDLPQTPAPTHLHARVMADIAAEPAAAEPERPGFRWRVLWPAAAAIVIAAVIALLLPGLRGRREMPGKAGEIDEAPEPSSYALRDKDSTGRVHREEAAPPSAPVVASLAKRGRAAKGGALPQRIGEMAEALVDDRDKVDLKRSGVDFASADVIEVAVPDPRAAFAQTISYASYNGWIAPGETSRALKANELPNPPVSQIILFLNDAELKQLWTEFARAGMQEVRGKEAGLRLELKAKSVDEMRKTAASRESIAFFGQRAVPPDAERLSEEKEHAGKAEAELADVQARRLPVQNRALLPTVQSVQAQNAILEDIKNIREPLRQITINFTSADAAAKAAKTVEAEAAEAAGPKAEPDKAVEEKADEP